MKTHAIKTIRGQLFTVLITIILCMPFFQVIMAQQTEGETLYFEDRVAYAMSTAKDGSPRSHYLGEETGIKYGIFYDLYSYTVSSGVMQTGQQVVVDKPVIYNAVKRVNRYYRQQLRRKHISEEEALQKVNHLFDVAISVYTQSTDALEDALRKVRKPDETAKVFERVELR